MVRILFFRDFPPWSPSHFLQRALEAIPDVDVMPVYVDRSSALFTVPYRVPSLSRLWFDPSFRHAARQYDRVGPFDLVLVGEWLNVPFRVRGLGRRSAYWAWDTPLGREQGRYRTLDRDYDLILNAQPKEATWLKEDFPSSRIVTFPFGADRRLFQPQGEDKDVTASFVGVVKAGKRMTFLREAQRLLPSLQVTEQFLPPWGYSGRLRSSRSTLHLSENGEVSIRPFEALCAGCRLVTDRVSDLKGCLGDLASEVVTFPDRGREGAKEMAATAVELLRTASPLPEAARAKALELHSYDARARTLLSLISA